MSTSGKWFTPSNPIDKHFTQNLTVPPGASISLPWVSLSGLLVKCSAEYKGSPKWLFSSGCQRSTLWGIKEQ